MYVKIVRSNRNADKKTNIENRLYSTNDVVYKKFYASDKNDFISQAPKSYILVADIPEEDFEFLNICLIDSSEKASKNIVAPCCSMFILNSDGKTIDSLHCK